MAKEVRRCCMDGWSVELFGRWPITFEYCGDWWRLGVRYGGEAGMAAAGLGDLTVGEATGEGFGCDSGSSGAVVSSSQAISCSSRDSSPFWPKSASCGENDGTSNFTSWLTGGEGVTDLGYGVSSSSHFCGFGPTCFFPFLLLFFAGTATGSVSRTGGGAGVSRNSSTSLIRSWAEGIQPCGTRCSRCGTASAAGSALLDRRERMR